jgi:hypothetical protein
MSLRFIENLIFPAKVLAVHMIWLPEGSKLTKVMVSAQSKPEVQSKIESKLKISN